MDIIKTNATLKFGFILILLLATSSSQELETNELNSANVKTKLIKKSSTDIFNAITGEVIGLSTLRRNRNGITINFKTKGLNPGHAYTLWWVVWNKPENCAVPGECDEGDFANAQKVEVQLIYASGHVAGNNGKGNFSAHLKENNSSGSIHRLYGLPDFGGLKDAQAAEIHAVLRSHGPKIPGQVSEQISSYEGGCIVSFPQFTEIPEELGECGDIIAALHRL